MEKLLIKHIVGYLPYSLKLKSGDFITEMCASLNYINDNHHHEFNTIDELCSGGKHWIKPILRPLFDLTKEIEVNGKSFVPAEYFWSVDDHEQQLFELYGTIPFYWKACLEVDIRDWEWGVVEKLYEWHFDLHNLIEKGLAIDLNTINNGIQ